MPNYSAPLRDMRFVLFELFNAEALWAALPGTAEVTRELADAVLEESAKICGECIAPLNLSGDIEGVHWHDGAVTTPAGFKEAFNTYRRGGWIGLSGAPGYLVGAPNNGLAYMFTMMNYERLGVGLQGLGCGERSYQGALAYARERLQGRAPGSRAAADPIIVHPDVRRMLLTQKAFNEGGRAFAAYVGIQLDIAKFGTGDAQQQAENKVALLTPIAKAFLTDKGFDACVLGQQVFGGHGYVREWGMEQLVRDARIAQIYEGTNGIQAMDFIGRKVLANGGRFLLDMRTEIVDFCAAAAEPAMAEFVAPVRAAVKTLESVTYRLLEAAQKNPDAVGAAAVEYLHLFGLTVYAYLWARTAQLALTKAAHDTDGFYRAKLHTARFYMAHCLPQVEGLARSIGAGADSIMALPAEHFAY